MSKSPRIQGRVTVSIVSHGQLELLLPLLDQLDQWSHESIHEVLLTVNIPEGELPQRAWRFPVQRLENARPQGFGANHNAALRRSGDTPWFLVLNPDIRLESDVIGAMLARADERSGLLSPRIQEPGRSAPEPFRGLLSPPELLRRRRAGHRPPAEPAWVAGMFMLLRRQAMAGVGGFDERFFMYCEDFDLCARLRLAGWALQIDRGSVVLHMAQRASNSSLRPLFWHLRSFARVWVSGAFWRYRALLRAQASGAGSGRLE